MCEALEFLTLRFQKNGNRDSGPLNCKFELSAFFYVLLVQKLDSRAHASNLMENDPNDQILSSIFFFDSDLFTLMKYQSISSRSKKEIHQEGEIKLEKFSKQPTSSYLNFDKEIFHKSFFFVPVLFGEHICSNNDL